MVLKTCSNKLFHKGSDLGKIEWLYAEVFVLGTLTELLLLIC